MIKNALSLILATLMTGTATAPAANPTATETKINTVALSYAEEFRATTSTATGIEYNADFATSTFVTADGTEYLAVFDTMGTLDVTDDEIIAMIPILK